MEALEKLIEGMPPKEAEVMRLLVDFADKMARSKIAGASYEAAKALQEANRIAGDV